MNVLVACEESQRVCMAFRERGHTAWSCDIQPCSGGHPGWHILGDCLPLLNGDCEFTTEAGGVHVQNGKWDLIIAHPPCTYLSNAGACRLYPRKGEIDEERFRKGLAAKAFFMVILNADCNKICVENPVSCKVFDMPPHTQEIQPYMFGHPYTKKTRLWLRGLSPLVPTDIVEPIGPYCPAGTGRKDRSKYGAAKRGEDAKNRAKTFWGIAVAFADQWGGDIRDGDVDGITKWR